MRHIILNVLGLLFFGLLTACDGDSIRHRPSGACQAPARHCT